MCSIISGQTRQLYVMFSLTFFVKKNKKICNFTLGCKMLVLLLIYVEKNLLHGIMDLLGRMSITTSYNFNLSKMIFF